MRVRGLTLKALAIGIVAAFAVVACGAGDDNDDLTLSFTGLDPLANGFHYEGWAIIDGSPAPTGKFNVDGSGRLVDLSGEVIEDGTFDTDLDLGRATAIVVTVEPAGDTDTVPASTHILAGTLRNFRGTLSAGHSAALGDSFVSSSGKYIVATPTNGDDTDENSGIWFLELADGPQQGLQLPTLPEGWHYEGWTVIDGTPVTTGRFTELAAPDFAAPYSGDQGGPPFPGEDFLRNAPAGLTFPTDIRGDTAVISIEPEPDDSPAPFTLKPLVGQIPADAQDHFTYDLGNNAASFPTGTVSIT